MALIKLASTFRRTPTLLIARCVLCPISYQPFFSHSSSSSSSSSSSNSTSSATLSSLTYISVHNLCTLKHVPEQTQVSDLEYEADGICIPSEPHVKGYVELLRKTKNFSSETEAMAFLDESGVRPTEDLVYSAIWALRKDWELAFLAFKWGEKLGCNSVRTWELMVWVLGKRRRFGTAWRVVRDMLRSSLDVRRAVLIMIKSYAAANDPQKAIRTFEAMKKFRIARDPDAFYTLLHALCKNGNIEEAEEFMLLNKNHFALATHSFNIILNGWCNISLDMAEAKRVWREMSNYCITPDATSYTHMISCFSKARNLFDSLRLYDEMKKRDWIPGIDVYNSLRYVLTQESCLTEALNLVGKIKASGLKPNSTTYNSMIVPLCEAKKLDEARKVLDDMIREGIEPTRRTYHAFLLGEVSVEGTLELLKQMSEADSDPDGQTFLLILNKFFELEQPENALRMWLEMVKYKVESDSAHYSVVIRGMITCGLLEKGREFYDEMRSKGFLDDPKLEKLLKESHPIGASPDLEEGQRRWKREEDKQKRHRKGGSKMRRKPQKLTKSVTTTNLLQRIGYDICHR